MPDIEYRAAVEADLTQIQAINAHYILKTSVTFKRAVPPLASYIAKLTILRDIGLPYLVAVDGDVVLGYTYLAPYRSSYPPTTELSLFVHPDHQSRAVGSALLEKMLGLVKEGTVVHRWRDENGGDEVPTVVRNVVAVMAVDPEGKDGGDALRRFYGKRGFRECGRLVKAGLKRGHWIDVIQLQFSTFEDDNDKI